MTNQHTPADLHIEKRDWKFGRDHPNPRWWLGGDPGRTAFFNALSSTFPLGEKFFMTSIKPYSGDVSEPLRSQIADFMFQESVHSREHVVFNRQAEDAGYDIDPLEKRTRQTIEWAKTRPPLQQLAATCALEHFTATFAHTLLHDPRNLDGAAGEAKRLWCWHAVEEIEHKGVAYDTYLHATRDLPKFRRWLKRCAVMVAVTARFHYVIFSNTADLLKQDGRNDWATWRRLLGHLYGGPGAMRHLLKAVVGYMKPGFHPWQEDDRPLVAEALAAITPSQAEALA